MCFRDLDSRGGPAGFVAEGDGIAGPPTLLTRQKLRAVVRAYLADGTRPTVVGWRESEWVR